MILGYRAASKAIRDGKIGKVIFFNAQVVNFIDKTSKWYNTPWRTIPDVSDEHVTVTKLDIQWVFASTVSGWIFGASIRMML